MQLTKKKQKTKSFPFLWATNLDLLLLDLPQPANGRSDGDRRGSGERVGTTGDDLAAALAVPDTGALTLDGVLAAEGAAVSGVLRDLNLAHKLT